jgi:hypothetical protein
MGSPVCIQRRGWRLVVADDMAYAPDLIDAALELGDGVSTPLRRSRHASTFLLRSPSGRHEADLFVKHFDPPEGLDRLKRWCRTSRPFRTALITTALREAGFTAPPVLLRGWHYESSRELVITARAEGDGPILAMRELGGSIAAKRGVLRALGREVGRLHRAGFIHGDLTPFNIRIALHEPPRFAFIDHDRTRRKIMIGRSRHRLRNLVQLGRFALPGITRTDRMRVFRAYEEALHCPHSRRLARKVAAMLQRRMGRATE